MREVLRSGNAFGTYRAERDARRALEGLAREHQWCFKLLGLESGAGLLLRFAGRPLQGRLRRQGARGAAPGARQDRPHAAAAQALAARRPDGAARRRGRAHAIARHRRAGSTSPRSMATTPTRREDLRGSAVTRADRFDIDAYRILTRMLRDPDTAAFARAHAAHRGLMDLTACHASLRGLEPARLRRLAGRASCAPSVRGDVRERALGVEFTGPLEVAYRACLESRVGSRVFLVVAQFTPPTDASFYDAARAIDWRKHIDPARTLACDFSGKHPEITHTRFGALRLKDAICDQLRDTTGQPPGHRDRAARGARARACQRPERHRVHRPVGRGPASARLSHAGRRSAAARESRRGNPGARGLAGEVQERRGVSRSDVRLGHAGHRSGDDRGQRRAWCAPALLRFPRLGGSRPRRLGAREARCAGARTETRRCDCAVSMRMRRVLRGGARQCRARRPG